MSSKQNGSKAIVRHMIQLRRYTISRFKRTVWQGNVPLPGNYIKKRALAKGFTNLSDKAHGIAFFSSRKRHVSCYS